MVSGGSRGLAIVASGPSGSGKTTLVKHLMLRDPRSHFSISATSRKPRGEEVDGLHYRFLSREDFLALRDRKGLLEWAEVHGEFYGTPRSEVVPYLQDGRHVFLDIDVQGGLSVKQDLGDRAYLLYVLPPDKATLEARLRGRGTDAEETIRLRMANAIGELAQLPHYDAVVVNDDLARAVEEASELIEIGEHNTERWLRMGGRTMLQDRFELTLGEASGS